jgi:hypothetical protein
MNGPLAQIVALTCRGDAAIAGTAAPRFFPGNSTTRFCDSIRFVTVRKLPLMKAQETVVAPTPDEWLSRLRSGGARGVRLSRRAQNDPQFSDRLTAGFVGGGGTWRMEVLLGDGRSEFWSAGWQVWSQKAPANRIWRVTYVRVGEAATAPDASRALAAIKADFKAALAAIHSLAAARKIRGFTECFAGGLLALDDPDADVGYHKDLAVPGQLGPDERSLLKAAMSAWVFGGMGSWNDLGFEGDSQKEYERTSDALFAVVNEAIAAAASATADRRVA